DLLLPDPQAPPDGHDLRRAGQEVGMATVNAPIGPEGRAAAHAARQSELRKRSSGRLMIFGFLSPSLAILLFMVAYPIFSLIYYSFHNFSALRQGAMKPV